MIKFTTKQQQALKLLESGDLRQVMLHVINPLDRFRQQRKDFEPKLQGFLTEMTEQAGQFAHRTARKDMSVS
jgi:hypothetical protein